MQSQPVINEESLKILTQFIQTRTGIVMSGSNSQLFQNRVVSRIRQLNVSGFNDYYDLLLNNNSDEINYLLNASTINFTSFMREKETFARLTDIILPKILQKNSADKKLRIWSAACSSGEEAYTLAIILREAMMATPGWDVKISATDIDTDMLEIAKEGIYPRNRIEVFNTIRQNKWFVDVAGSESMVKVKPELQSMVEFRQLNLIEPWEMTAKFDLIFCRNVLIYFDKSTRLKLLGKFSEKLNDDGWFIIGRSESIYGYDERFEMKGDSIYRLR